MIKLGQKVRDVVTGFEGIADCRLEWLNGCVRIQVQPKARKDKGVLSVPEAKVFDEEQLEIVNEKPVALPNHKSREETGRGFQTGGDRPTPAMRRDPR